MNCHLEFDLLDIKKNKYEKSVQWRNLQNKNKKQNIKNKKRKEKKREKIKTK